MNKLLYTLRVFKPRSTIGYALALFALSAGVWLSPLVNLIASEPRPWLPQFLAAALLGDLGFALGLVLRKIRAWTPSPLVPGLMYTHLTVALSIVICFWAIYVMLMVAQELLYGLPVTLSLTIGILALFLAAGIHRRLTITMLGSSVLYIIMTMPWLSQGPLILIRHPWADMVLVIVSAIATLEMFRMLARPISNNEVAQDEHLVYERINARLPVPRVTIWMPITRTLPGRAFTIVLEHTRGRPGSTSFY